MERVIAQQQPIKFEGKIIRIGGHCIDASIGWIRKNAGWENSLTDSTQVHYVHCLLGDAIKAMYVTMSDCHLYRVIE